MSLLLLDAGRQDGGSGVPPVVGPSLRGVQNSGVGGTVNLPTNAAGDRLIVHAVYNAGAIPTAAGWTARQLQNDSSSTYRLVMFTKASTGGETTFTSSPAAVSAWSATAWQDATTFDTSNSTGGSDIAAPYELTIRTVTPTVVPALVIDSMMGVMTPGTLTMPLMDTQLPQIDNLADEVSLRVGYRTLSILTPTGVILGTSNVQVSYATASVIIY